MATTAAANTLLGIEFSSIFQESLFHFVFILPLNLDSPNNNNSSITTPTTNNNNNNLQFYKNQEVLNIEEEKNQVDFNGLDQNDAGLVVARLHNKRPYFPAEKMEDNYRYQHQHQLNRRSEQKPNRPSRLGLRTGEIVEVQGGHIVRSTGLKDRHSKVCTAKGPRDRRVRLSANTAIQFYDVQDRLGYDRPSKAVDWLIKKAKAAIDELEELPAWTPTAGSAPVVNLEQNPNSGNVNCRGLRRLEEHPDEDIVDNQMGIVQNSSFLPVSIDSLKSFFPTGGSTTPAGFHFPPAEIVSISTTQNQNQDLKLSLQSFQDHMPQSDQGNNNNNNNNNICFDGSGWPENGGFVFNSPAVTQTTPFLQPLFGQPTNNQMMLNYISQRGPLQSSNLPSVRAWVDPYPFVGGAAVDPHQTLNFHHPVSMPGLLYPGMGGGGFSGFHVPARIPGEEEEHDGLSDKPSSGSSDSRH